MPSFLFECVCVCVRGRCGDGRGQAPSRDVYCQEPEWDKDLNRNFKATSVSSPPSSSQSLGCVMVNKLPFECVCVCVCGRGMCGSVFQPVIF